MATGPSRTEAERERDYTYIAQWYMQAWTQFRITEELNNRFYPERPLTRAQIAQDIKKIVGRWRDRASTAIEQRKAEELARIDRLESEYWDAWERSKETAKTISRKGEAVFQTLKDSDGNPAFLQGIERCIDKRVKILGLAAPMKLQFEGTDNELVERIKGSLATLGLVAGGSQPAQAEPGRDETDD